MGKSHISLALLEILDDEERHKISELGEKLNLKSTSIRLYVNELLDFGHFIESYRGKNGGYRLVKDKKKKYYISIV